MNLKLKQKLLIYFILIGIIPVILFGFLSLSRTENTIRNQIENQLNGITEMKANQIEKYFEELNNHILILSENLMIIQAMKEFKEAFWLLEKENGEHYSKNKHDYENKIRQRIQYQIKNTYNPPDSAITDWYPPTIEGQILQYNYIGNNPHPIGEKENLLNANDGSSWSKLHEKYHPVIRSFLQKFGYYDIFLVEPQNGFIVYSVFKEIDLGTSLFNGIYSTDGIGAVFQSAMNKKEKDFVAIDDFRAYPPSYNTAQGFISSPIYDGDKLIGVLIFQMPIDHINDVMSTNENWENVGFGKTGEAYLVGGDMTMRNNSRYMVEDKNQYIEILKNNKISSKTINAISEQNTTIGLLEINSPPVLKGLKKLSGIEYYNDDSVKKNMKNMKDK